MVQGLRTMVICLFITSNMIFTADAQQITPSSNSNQAHIQQLILEMKGLRQQLQPLHSQLQELMSQAKTIKEQMRTIQERLKADREQIQVLLGTSGH